MSLFQLVSFATAEGPITIPAITRQRLPGRMQNFLKACLALTGQNFSTEQIPLPASSSYYGTIYVEQPGSRKPRRGVELFDFRPAGPTGFTMETGAPREDAARGLVPKG
jgi:hypothetical protein